MKERSPEGKAPAQAIELEEAILGVLLLEPQKIEDVVALLPHSEYFYKPAHQHIYESILSLYNRGMHVDIYTLVQELTTKGEIELVGGAYTITQLTQAIASSAHIVSHCAFIKEKFLKRKLVSIGATLQLMGHDSSDIFQDLDKVEQLTAELSLSVGSAEAAHISTAISEAVQDIARLRDLPEDTTGITTGSVELDNLLGGWQETDLIVLGASPGTGKTAAALGWCIAAARHGKAAAIFSLEMSRMQITKRILANITNTPNKLIKLPKTMASNQFTQMVEIAEKHLKLPLYIDDTQNLSLFLLKSKIRRIATKKGVKLVVIDYLQLMHLPGGSFNKNDDLGEITKSLKALAKELKITIILLSQLTRDSKKTTRVPQPHDLRDSGAIEADADIVILLYHPLEQDIKEHPALKNAIIANIGKHRNGETDKIPFWVKWDTFTFSDTPFSEWITAESINNMKQFDQQKEKL